jgi:histidine triad (HIT) family protein
MEDSIFTKIIKGEIPCHKVYEDKLTIAFLDIHPLINGHTLVIPKKQIDNFEELPEEDYQAVFSTVQKVALRLKEVYGVKKASVIVLGFDVPHAHVHVIPTGDSNSFYAAIENRNPVSEPDHSKLAEIAKKLAF